MTIDITFDFRTDATGKNPDPDASSPTLLRYHHLLWSKPLPSGKHFELTPRSEKPHALLHDSELGKFLLTSDSVLPTDRWLNWPTQAGLPGGCPWAAAAFELDDTDGPVRDHVAASLARWTALLTALVEDAIAHSHLRADLDVEQFVWQLHGLYLGHHVAQRLLRQGNADRRARAMFDGLVAASLPPTRHAPTRRTSRTPGQQR